MNEQERNEVNHLTAMAGESPACIGGHVARHITLETISVLDMCGSPVAAPIRGALNGVTVDAAPSIRLHDLAVLAWAFCAPEDDVLTTALECTPSYNVPAVKAALKFTRAWQPSDLKGILVHVEGEIRALQAAFFESAAPDYGQKDAKKNNTANAASRS